MGKREAVVGMSAHPAATCWPSRDGWDCEIFNFCLHFWSSTVPVLLHLHLHFRAVFSRDTGEKKKKNAEKQIENYCTIALRKKVAEGAHHPQLPELFFFFFFSELDCAIVSTRTVLDISLERIRCTVNYRV